MSTTELEKVMQEVKALPPDDLRKVKMLIDSLLNQTATSPEEELAQRLLAAGLISEIKPRITDMRAYQDRKPIEYEGKLVSEILIEERR